MAAATAGDDLSPEKGKGGLVGYLAYQAKENPASFLPLLGKVLPMQIAGSGEGGAIGVTIQFE